MKKINHILHVFGIIRGKSSKILFFCAKFTEIAAQYKAFSLPCGGGCDGGKKGRSTNVLLPLEKSL